jgi:hypothetical protein
MIRIKGLRQKILGSLRAGQANNREKHRNGKIIKILAIKVIEMVLNGIGLFTAFKEGIFVVFNTFLSLGQVRQGSSQSVSV